MSSVYNYFNTQRSLFYSYKDGSWGDGLESLDQKIKVHMAATALHYGQSAIEGLRLIKGVDGQLRAFRLAWHCQSLRNSSERVFMPIIEEEFFKKVVKKFIEINGELFGALENGGSVYLRLVLFGNGPRIGIQPSDEYALAIAAGPARPLLGESSSALLYTDLDRSPLFGTGPTTLAGNYTPGLLPASKAAEQGYALSLFSDSKENLFVDGSVDAPLIALKDGKLIMAQCSSSPRSSVGDSIVTLAEKVGYKIGKETLQISELGQMEELAAAANMNGVRPINKLKVNHGESFTYEEAKVFPKLTKELLEIQQGILEDSANWCTSLT